MLGLNTTMSRFGSTANRRKKPGFGHKGKISIHPKGRFSEVKE